MISLSKSKQSPIYRAFNLFLIFAFTASMCVAPTGASAQTVMNLPAPGTMIMPSASYSPPIMAGITIYPENPLQFDFLIAIA